MCVEIEIARQWVAKAKRDLVIPLELLRITKMSSGNDSLELTERVSWQRFPQYATKIVNILEGEIINKADSIVERVWDVCINGERFWLSFNDFGLGVSLDSQTPQASRQIAIIRDKLDEWKLRDAENGNDKR